jgi:hypothetical protein
MADENEISQLEHINQSLIRITSLLETIARMMNSTTIIWSDDYGNDHSAVKTVISHPSNQ